MGCVLKGREKSLSCTVPYTQDIVHEKFNEWHAIFWNICFHCTGAPKHCWWVAGCRRVTSSFNTNCHSCTKARYSVRDMCNVWSTGIIVMSYFLIYFPKTFYKQKEKKLQENKVSRNFWFWCWESVAYTTEEEICIEINALIWALLLRTRRAQNFGCKQLKTREGGNAAVAAKGHSVAEVCLAPFIAFWFQFNCSVQHFLCSPKLHTSLILITFVRHSGKVFSTLVKRSLCTTWEVANELPRYFAPCNGSVLLELWCSISKGLPAPYQVECFQEGLGTFRPLPSDI